MIDDKKNKIIKFTNNIINNFYDNFNVIFDEQQYSKNIIIYKTNKKILTGKYEILGYFNNGIWTWSFDNKFVEKYLTSIAKKLSKNKDIIKCLDNINNNINLNINLNLFLELCLFHSDKIWIIKNNINRILNQFEFIIITDIQQIF